MICPTKDRFKSALQSVKRLRWMGSEKSLEYSIYRSAFDVPEKQWNTAIYSNNPFLSLDYLKGMEAGLKEQDDFRLAIFFNEKKVAGAAVFHVTSFEADGLGSEIENRPLLSFIGKTMGSDTRRYNILICGNAFSTGEHGFLFRPDIPMSLAMDSLCYCLTSILDEFKPTDKQISAVVVKDFYKENYSFTQGLKSCGFTPFKVDHTMVLPLLPEWKSFDDYLQSLNTKFRTKANAAYKKSAELTVQQFENAELKQYQSELFELYEQVYQRADFRMGKLSPTTFLELKKTLGDRLMVKGYFHNNQLVGFLTTILGTKEMEAHMVGFDYAVNQHLGIYPRILYDFIEIGIENRVEKIVYGRTAGEIKSSIGAFPVDLMCCIRHPGRISNLLLGHLFCYVKPTEFPMRSPWKAVTLQQLQGQYGDLIRTSIVST